MALHGRAHVQFVPCNSSDNNHRLVVFLPGHSNSGTLTAAPILPVLNRRDDVLVVNYSQYDFRMHEVVTLILEAARKRRRTELVLVSASFGSLVAKAVMTFAVQHPYETKVVGNVIVAGMSQRGDLALPASLYRIIRGPLATPTFQNAIRAYGNSRDPIALEDVDPVTGICANQAAINEHYAAMAALPGPARRAQLALLADLPDHCTSVFDIPCVYIQCRQHNGSDGMVRPVAYDHMQQMFRDCQLIEAPTLHHASFVEQPEGWRLVMSDALNRLMAEL